MQTIKLNEIIWDPKIYPREKWNSSTIERYADAMEAGAEFPPLILEQYSNRLLDGKHRFEAYKKVGISEVTIEHHAIPDGMSTRYYAASLSARHGDRLSNSDLKRLAETDFEHDSNIDPKTWGKNLGLSKSTVYRWVSHILERERNERGPKAWHLSRLGWTQCEIGEQFGVAQSVISDFIGNSHLGKIDKTLGDHWNEKGIAELANRLNLGLTDCYAAAMDDMDDQQRLKTLNISLRPYDVWMFPKCHDLMGDSHPGRIPGELIAHVLYFFTNQGDLVIDPMAGSGTTLDACLLMGRKARGYDIDQRHDRIDIEKHDLSTGWPEITRKADLIFWDPPYFDKMDSSTIGAEGYIDGSISGLTPEKYMEWLFLRFKQAFEIAKKGAKLAFLMSDWDAENAKKHKDSDGLWIWDYANNLTKAGWNIKRHIQCPLNTQQIHPDIINKFRDSRRLARLERYLLISEKA